MSFTSESSSKGRQLSEITGITVVVRLERILERWKFFTEYMRTRPSEEPAARTVLSKFQQAHPDLKVEYAEDSRLYRLEHGEAHVSIRPGSQPLDPDYVVQELANLDASLYASQSYIKKHGSMKSGKTRQLVQLTFSLWLQTRQLPLDVPVVVV